MMTHTTSKLAGDDAHNLLFAQNRHDDGRRREQRIRLDAHYSPSPSGARTCVLARRSFCHEC